MNAFNPYRSQRVVWIQTAFLGDLVLTTAAIRLLAQQRPELQQFMVTTPLGSDLFQGVKELTETIVFDKEKSSLLQSFRRVKESLSKLGCEQDNTVTLQAHRSFRSSLLSRYLGYYTITYRQTNFAFLANMRIERVATFHEVQRIALLLTGLGIERECLSTMRPCLDPLPLLGTEAWHEKILKATGKVLAIAPGSVWGTKMWPIEYYQQLVQKLGTHQNFSILLLGSKKERWLTDQLVLSGDVDRTINLAGKTTLDDLRRVYPRLNLLVSNDSSPIHFASAFGVPTLALFGATVPAMGFGPLAPGSKTMGVKGLSCRPCSDHGPKVCPKGHFKCMLDLKVEDVYQRCLTMLSDGAK
jgi:heptosyltransferase-2